MAITHPAKRLARRAERRRLGPPLTFAAAVSVVFAAVAVSAATLPSDFVLPLISALLFGLAGSVALVACSRGRLSEQPTRLVTYWDVAGALTLLGICAAALADPDQVVRLIESAPREK